jgi:hypothetical protein
MFVSLMTCGGSSKLAIILTQASWGQQGVATGVGPVHFFGFYRTIFAKQ